MTIFTVINTLAADLKYNHIWTEASLHVEDQIKIEFTGKYESVS